MILKRIKYCFKIFCISLLLFSKSEARILFPNLPTGILDPTFDYRNSHQKKFAFPEVDQKLIHIHSLNSEDDPLEDIFRKEESYNGNPKVQKARKYLGMLSDSRLISKLTGDELMNLPLGIKKTIGGYSYSIVFAGAKIFPTHAELEIYGHVQREGGEDLIFGAEDIKFSFEGGIIGDATLGLYSDFPIPLGTAKMAMVFKAFQQAANGNHEGSYIRVDCDGFVDARLDADIFLSRDWVLPLDSEGQVIENDQRVTSNFSVNISDFNDLVTEISLDPFCLSKEKSVGFYVNDLVFDYSDQKNAPGFQIPPSYDFTTGSFIPQQDQSLANLWKGIFVREMEVILPEAFNQSGDILKFGANNLYIDSRGVTGQIFAEDVLPFSVGQIGESGWGFSLNKVHIELIYSKLYTFGFEGQLGLPVLEEDKPLNYSAFGIPSQSFYNFSIELDSTLAFPMFKASTVELGEGSLINVEIKEDQFKPTAILSGHMDIELQGNEENQNTNLEIGNIEFNKLIVETEAPFLSLSQNGGSISFISGPVLNNTILNIDHATITRIDDRRVMFTLGMEAAVMSEEDGGAKTAGEFGIVANLSNSNNRLKWAYEEIKLIALEVYMDFADAGFIGGGIRFFSDDPIYGNGFSGALEGGFLRDRSGTEDNYKLKVNATARFGTKNQNSEEEFKYWSFDVYVSSDEFSVPIYPPIEANGFGGGAYHHMRMTGYDMVSMAQGAGDYPYSGIIYEPDPDIALGIKVSLGIVLQEVDAFQGNLTLEMAFTDKLSLAEIYMYGNGELVSDQFNTDVLDNMTKLTKNKEQVLSENETEASQNNLDKITAAIMLRISLDEGFEMHGSFGIFMNAANGKIKGQGIADLYASVRNKSWHLYIGGYTNNSITDLEGEPIPPVSASINFDGFSVQSSMYMLTGNDLPGPPPVNPLAAASLNVPENSNNRNLLNTDGRSTSKGSAFAMGMSTNFNFQKQVLLLFDLQFSGLAGFDIALLSNPSSSTCSVNNISPHGIKGWRATGDIYAYLEVEGYRRRLFGRDFYLGKVNAGIFMNGDIPSPSYFIVEGFIDFSFININFKEELGERCGEVVSN